MEESSAPDVQYSMAADSARLDSVSTYTPMLAADSARLESATSSRRLESATSSRSPIRWSAREDHWSFVRSAFGGSPPRLPPSPTSERFAASMLKAARYRCCIEPAATVRTPSAFTVSLTEAAARERAAGSEAREERAFDEGVEDEGDAEAADYEQREPPLGGEELFVRIFGVARVHARVCDNADGSYTVTWQPPQSGIYSVGVMMYGVHLQGSPFEVVAATPEPCASKCEVSGGGLTSGVARETLSFQMAFKDSTGAVTHACELDCFVEAAPTPSSSPSGSPRSSSRRRPTPDAKGSPLADPNGHAGPSGGGGGSGSSPGPQPLAASTGADTSSTTRSIASTAASGSSSTAGGKRRLRVKILTDAPLPVRSECEAGSLPMGFLRPGTVVTILEERVDKASGDVHALLALDASVSNGQPKGREGRQPIRPPSLLAAADATPLPAPPSPSSLAPLAETKLLSSDLGVKGAAHARVARRFGHGLALSTDTVHKKERGVDAPSARPSQRPSQQSHRPRNPIAAPAQQQRSGVSSRAPAGGVSVGGSAGSSGGGGGAAGKRAVGWATIVRGGSKLVTSRLRLEPGTRQTFHQQWVRRGINEKVRSAVTSKAGEEAPSRARQVAMDATYVRSLAMELASAKEMANRAAFCYGGVYPGGRGGTHAEKRGGGGAMPPTHRVNFSIGVAGQYLLHVRLRKAAAAVPGSPFALTIKPGAPHALSTALPPKGLAGEVGTDLALTFRTGDKMGNACVTGGGKVTCTHAEALRHVLSATVSDNGDGSYTVVWVAKQTGVFEASVRIDGTEVLHSPLRVRFVSTKQALHMTEISGEGLKQARAQAERHGPEPRRPALSTTLAVPPVLTLTLVLAPRPSPSPSPSSLLLRAGRQE